MKKIILSLATIVIAVAANAQTCSDLFISEYVEGSNNNKALEIYNPTSAPVSLANYRLVRWSNGATDINALQGEILPLPTTATIASKDVYVIVINTTDQGTDTVPFADLASKADVQLTTSCDPNTPNNVRTMCFNGDDALSLQKNVDGTWTNVDIFGVIGERPTNGAGGTSPTGAWTNIAPYSSRDPQGSIPSNQYFLYYWSQDQTLIRKSTIVNGRITNPIPNTGGWNVATEWDSLPRNTFTELGSHDCDCNTVSVAENTQEFTATLWPNPAQGEFNIKLSVNILAVNVYNANGQLVLTQTPNNTKQTSLNIGGLPQGLYSVTAIAQNGASVARKLVVK